MQRSTPAVLDHAIEACVIVMAGADEIVKTIDAEWRPIAVQLKHDVALRGGEAHAKEGRRAAIYLR